MLISTKGRYALRVLVDMAEHQSEGYVPLKEIADRQEISEKYLETIVKSLVKEGVLIGLRGKGGGYRLSKTPEHYTVGSILRMTEGSLSPVACLGDGYACPRMTGCRTLPMWQGLDKLIDEYLDSYTIEDLMRTDDPGDDYVI
jgi:Rrf2 family protein